MVVRYTVATCANKGQYIQLVLKWSVCDVFESLVWQLHFEDRPIPVTDTEI